MFIMKQKCSYDKVFEVFIIEPLKVHYIKEISKKISLAPTSVKNHLKALEKDNLIVSRKGDLFPGFIANRDNEEFKFYKKLSNIAQIKESGLLDFLIDNLHPFSINLYGSYFKGDDVESSDIDIMIITNEKRLLKLDKFEKILDRKIHIIQEKNLKKIPESTKSEIINGIVLYGYLKNEYR